MTTQNMIRIETFKLSEFDIKAVVFETGFLQEIEIPLSEVFTYSDSCPKGFPPVPKFIVWEQGFRSFCEAKYFTHRYDIPIELRGQLTTITQNDNLVLKRYLDYSK